MAVDAKLLHASADALVRDYMGVGAGELVVITADGATDPAGVAALEAAAREQGARVTIQSLKQLPFQGMLADPYIPASVAAAVKDCDAWFDLTFPYMAGSSAHSAAVEAGRVRSLLLADLGAEGIVHLFSPAVLDRLFALQTAMDELLSASVGAECRITCARGTDFRFAIGKPTTKKLRRSDKPGTYTPPGSAIFYPREGSMAGEIVLSGVFHEHHTRLAEPLRLRIDGEIRDVSGGGADLEIFRRALRRASGGKYGSVIHLTHGFHPGARFSGRSFIEDIRARGSDAIGFGTPWWEPGGGENHPDGVVTGQSLWIGGRQIVKDGAMVAPPALVQLEGELHAT